MSEDGISETHEHELATLARLPILPQEVQNRILQYCDLPSRSMLCRLNREWNKTVTPFLWQDLDFVTAFEGSDLIEATRRFFCCCDSMINERPERFKFLASQVKSMDVGRLHGINIVDEEWDNSDFPYFDDAASEDERNVFDVIANFTNLTSLTIYMKNWWPWTTSGIEQSGQALTRNIKRLKALKTGGQMSVGILQGLLNSAEKLQHLSLFNLNEVPGQDNGPDGIVVLEGLYDRFTSLETLHLCKLADLDPRIVADNDDGAYDDVEWASGMAWKFPREAEVSVLAEWASLLRHTSKTLSEVTLENRYLCSEGFDDKDLKIDPANAHPADYGAVSIRESQKALFPVLLDERWPKLKLLTMIAMGTTEDVRQATCHLEPQVRIEQRLAGIEIIEGDSTPEQISTPAEFANLQL